MKHTTSHTATPLTVHHGTPSGNPPRYILRIATACTQTLAMLLALVLPTGCINEEEYADTPSENLKALWQIMDEHYCFFDEKRETLGVEWDEVGRRYIPQATDRLSHEQLFELCANMLGELRDGHVNLVSAFDYARNWSWKEDYPTNLSDTLIRRYLGTDYRIAATLNYRILPDNIGYVRCPSFSTAFGEGNLDEVMLYLAPCNGIIIDVRSNGGGMLTAAERLAARFTDTERLVGYMRHKTGKGHNDFSPFYEQRLTPPQRLRWQKPVAVLTNRGVYSAANEFVKYMRVCGAVIIGDATGGGGGLPFSSELPNGWAVRFSACPMYDTERNSVENGILPDISVSLNDDDIMKGEDTIIEAARGWINRQ